MARFRVDNGQNINVGTSECRHGVFASIDARNIENEAVLGNFVGRSVRTEVELDFDGANDSGQFSVVSVSIVDSLVAGGAKSNDLVVIVKNAAG